MLYRILMCEYQMIYLFCWWWSCVLLSDLGHWGSCSCMRPRTYSAVHMPLLLGWNCWAVELSPAQLSVDMAEHLKWEQQVPGPLHLLQHLRGQPFSFSCSGGDVAISCCDFNLHFPDSQWDWTLFYMFIGHLDILFCEVPTCSDLLSIFTCCLPLCVYVIFCFTWSSRDFFFFSSQLSWHILLKLLKPQLYSLL